MPSGLSRGSFMPRRWLADAVSKAPSRRRNPGMYLHNHRIACTLSNKNKKEIIMATRRIREFLDRNNARYVMIHHSPAFTASEVAASVHMPGKQLAKSVMVKIDGQLAIAVVSATRDVDFELLRAEV